MSLSARLVALPIALAACRSPSMTAERPRPSPAPPAPTDVRTGEPTPAEPPAPPGAVEDRLVLERVGFSDLPGWGEDEVGKAIPAFLRSCEKLRRMRDDERVGRTDTGGLAADWRRACERARRVAASDHAAARAFFEAEFAPFLARNNADPIGRFTGYYEARLRGSLRRHGKYQVPLYRRPPDLITVELSKFLADGRGRRLAGRVVGKSLVPYDTRADIVGGSLAGKKLELVWLDDAIDAFFVQVQGSGKVQLDTGAELRIGYAATNGRRYTAIGRVLIAEGHLTRETVSMQSIRAYLLAHPERADPVMNQNESYVFFDAIRGDGPLGSQGVALTDGRSIAIDRNYIPQSAPVWLDTVAPVAGAVGEAPLRRLVIAQDTGGAILGPVRADVYWGGDEAAADVAGRMKSTGRYFLLLPIAAAERLGPGGEPRLTPQTSGTSRRLQAVSAVDDRVVWASGLGGTYAVTTDGGATWRSAVVPGAEKLEFRDVHALSDRAAYLLASGPGELSRIYQTTDGGASWTLQIANPDPRGFWDCFAFFSPTRAVLMADAVDRRFPLVETSDGQTWRPARGRVPAALAGEAAFASSGTCVAAQSEKLGWILTGGADRARVLATRDGGASWEAYSTPIRGGSSAGGFSIAFRDAQRGVAAGGSLAAPTAHSASVARSTDGGKTWRPAAAPAFPGAIYGLAYAVSRRGGGGERVPVVATGPGGSAWSPDEGDTWRPLPGATGYWAVAFADERTGWLVGVEGHILKIELGPGAAPPAAR